ncbi:hypothetical protein GCM10010124_31440 [Pilimelia terevasa]|uniref:Cytosine-specific methyltransferase n=1 Tax=Pilimelia terevasa TaxID=53372 RepID=A0A8J3BPH1_9ACTN|nr:DNA (cytosine-5-)-methyltransferase [Pilimelia terevasa]GGK36501.1 hypothetical protein GCM10010124_31440 [Pilimelia terevasa]
MNSDAHTPTTRRPRVGSLCSGYGGLDLAVELVLRGELAWYAETDRHANRVMAARWPGIGNLGDIQHIDWGTVPRVDVLTAGFPCQDISNAGGRTGISGPKSSLWGSVAHAVGELRPSLVFVENVAALLRRGLDVVHRDLAALGYDTRWTCVRASDVGAPHRRDRLFLLGHHRDQPWLGADAADAVRPRRQRARPPIRPARPDRGGPAQRSATSDADRRGVRVEP